MKLLWMFFGWVGFSLALCGLLIACSEFTLWRERRRLTRELDSYLREWTRV